MTQSSFDSVRRRCSPLLRSTDGRQSQRQRDYATVEATGEIDLERPWVYTDAEIADLAARVRWAQIDLAARERWAHIENDEAFEVLKSLHDPHDGRTELRIKNLVGVLEEVPTNLFWPVFLNTWPNCDQTWPFQKNCCGCFDIMRVGSHGPQLKTLRSNLHSSIPAAG